MCILQHHTKYFLKDSKQNSSLTDIAEPMTSMSCMTDIQAATNIFDTCRSFWEGQSQLKLRQNNHNHKDSNKNNHFVAKLSKPYSCGETKLQKGRKQSKHTWADSSTEGTLHLLISKIGNCPHILLVSYRGLCIQMQIHGGAHTELLCETFPCVN